MTEPSAARNAGGISRRAFLRLLVLSAAAATAGHTVLQRALAALATSAVDQGVLTEKWIATSCLNCPGRCATLVRVVNDKVVQVKGNPLSRVTGGAVCPRAHVALQVLYDPDRLKGPVRRTNPQKGRGVDPEWAPLSWGEALGEVGRRLQGLRDAGRPERLLLLQGLNSSSDEDIIRLFAHQYGTPNLFSEAGQADEADKAGEWFADGNYTRSAYDLDRTAYILAFGAGILESEAPLARNLRMWGKFRRERPNRARVTVIDPRYSVTAARADRWIPINPGTDAALAMGIASVIISEELYDRGFVGGQTTGFEAYRELALRAYSPDEVSTMTGVPAVTIRDIAREFALTRPAIAWRGSGATGWRGGSYTAYAIFCLNALVGSIDSPGGVLYQEYPPYREVAISADEVSRRGLSQRRVDSGWAPIALGAAGGSVARSILNGGSYPVDMALGLNCNFSMTSQGSRWDGALAKLPYYVHVAPFASEMAQYADVILPCHTFLEQWGYEHSPPSSGFAEARLKQPVAEPVHDTMSTGDIVLELGRRAGVPMPALNARDFVGSRTASFQRFTEEGVWRGEDYRYHKYDSIFKTPSGNFEFVSENLRKLRRESGISAEGPLTYLPHYEPPPQQDAAYPLLLTAYQPAMSVQNGSQNYPWAQQQYLVMHGRGWTNFAEISAGTAQELGIRDGDEVWVESQAGKLKLRARVIQGIHPGAVAIAAGQGHYAYGRWQKGIGANPNQIISGDTDPLTGQPASGGTPVRVYRT